MKKRFYIIYILIFSFFLFSCQKEDFEDFNLDDIEEYEDGDIIRHSANKSSYPLLYFYVSGDWGDVNNWSLSETSHVVPSRIPTQLTNVEILPKRELTVDTSIYFTDGGITVLENANLILNKTVRKLNNFATNSDNFSASGDWSNNIWFNNIGNLAESEEYNTWWQERHPVDVFYEVESGSTKLLRYNIYINMSGRAPKDWKLWGSNDFQNWSLLDEQTNISFSWPDVNWGDVPGANRSFIIPPENREYYSHYKLEILDAHHRQFVRMLELHLYEDAGSPIRMNVSSDGWGSIMWDKDIHETNEVVINFDFTRDYHKKTSNLGWFMISSPIQNQKIEGFTENSFFKWYEPAQVWVNSRNLSVWPTWTDVNRSDTLFADGNGYLASFNVSNGDEKQFIGKPIKDEISVVLHRFAHPSDPYVGFNLIGNPYVSYLDWKHPSWDFSSLVENNGGYEFWIWNDVTGNYGVFNSNLDKGTNGVSQYIPPTQAFWVRASIHGSRLTLPRDAISFPFSDDKQITKSSGVSSELSIEVVSNVNSFSDNIIISHNDFNGGSSKMGSLFREAPALYTIKDNKNYSIDIRDSIDVIELEFKPGIDGTYILKFSNNINKNLVLKDLITGEEIILRNKGFYRFSASTTDITNRFVITNKTIDH